MTEQIKVNINEEDEIKKLVVDKVKKTMAKISRKMFELRMFPNFKKGYFTDTYLILFDPESGTEVLTGLEGYEDPFSLIYPSLMDIGVMGHCKNDCKICYQGQRSRPNMTVDDFKTIITQSPYVNQVALGGKGDPNLHENFEEILKICRDNEIIPNYTTSGNGLTDEQIELTKKYCGAVAVSNYNQPHTYEAITKFMNAGMKTNIHFVLSKDTYEDAINILHGKDVWDGKVDLDKLNAIIFLLFKPQGKAKEMTDLTPLPWMFDRISEKIKHPETKFKIGMDSCMTCRISQIRELTEEEKLFADNCEGSRMSCYISPDMYFMPCSFGNQEEWGTKIEGDNIMKIWTESDKILKFRDTIKQDPKTCPFGL